MKRSKAYTAAQKLIESGKQYSVAEAVDIIKKTAKTKFDSSVEVHMKLGIDPKLADQIVRGSCVLPHGTGKKIRIAVFAEGEDAAIALQNGAAIAGSDEIIKGIKETGVCDFDIAVAVPSMMKKLSAVAKTLGQKGLMPNPRNETITTNVKKTLDDLQKGKITFRNDDSGNMHQLVGKASWDAQKLVENIQQFVSAIRKIKPSSAKGTYIQSITVKSTMGPGIKVTP
ncbi:50S ribosomal protein L1 [Candidatus Kaiserbacteria bacterium RIFCSPHIGHO2_01_FULL_48_10]|uniref:Large ribosomal subunit protein uL1 n=1 Tax=Candidatus Kaiserbacteria bacterium RIFCSPHIGHO2_01_FULL_48_10 TaxID=1798476 RepID=A0A1F6C3I5_9BACT|nr:MAG: 50S ribosomal protein L1 [Candidatus Kaiserbacteria bacterium RIFCSPHIGHO2_01_FULL_48_10]HLC99571.1 50S ribosomal protein L1 [Patescibacteria group bacterium]